MALERIKENNFRARVIALIEEEFPDLSKRSVAKVLAQLVRSYDSNLHLSVASEISTPALNHPSTAKAFVGTDESSFGVMDYGSTIQLVAEEPGHVDDLLRQIVSVGAVLIQIDREVKLNDLIAVHIELVPYHFQVDFVGRVVSVTPSGTAIEVSKITQEDRAALERLFEESEPMTQSVSRTTSPGADSDEFILTGMRRDNSSVSQSYPDSSFARSEGDSLFTIRRHVEMTRPDVHMIKALTQNRAISIKPGEYYGPHEAFVESSGKPARVEDLSSDLVLDILLQQSQQMFTGAVEIKRAGKTSYQLHFDSGLLAQIVCEPRQPALELGPMLLAAKRLTREQLDMAAAHADEEGIEVSRALLDLNILTAESLRHTLAGRLTFILQTVVKIQEGAVNIIPADAMPTGFLPLPPLRVHLPVERPIYDTLYDSLRGLPIKEREARIREQLDAYPEIIIKDDARLSHTVEDSTHLRFVHNILNGKRRLREAITESALSGVETFAVVFTLHRMGLLSFDTSLHHTVVRERYRENVTVKYLSVHKASYFEVLNVHWSSYSEVIHAAYETLRGQFDPATIPEHLEAEVHQRVREISERVEQAHQVLSHRKSRHAYRTRIMPEYKLQHAVPLFLKQCDLAQKRGQFNDAIDGIRRALEIAPEHRDAANWRLRLEALSDDGGLGADMDSTFL